MNDADLLARKNGNWYYKYLDVWPEGLRGHLVRERTELNGRELEITRKFICYPTKPIVEEIKEFFYLRKGEVYKRAFNGDFKEKNFALVADMKVPPEYIKAVLKGKKPNISGLFEQKGNRLFRSDSTFWGPEFRGVLVGEIECCGLYLW